MTATGRNSGKPKRWWASYLRLRRQGFSLAEAARVVDRHEQTIYAERRLVSEFKRREEEAILAYHEDQATTVLRERSQQLHELKKKLAVIDSELVMDYRLVETAQTLEEIGPVVDRIIALMPARIRVMDEMDKMYERSLRVVEKIEGIGELAPTIALPMLKPEDWRKVDHDAFFEGDHEDSISNMG